MNAYARRVEFEDAGAPGVDWEEETGDFAAAPDTRALSDIADMAHRLLSLDEEIASAKAALKALLDARTKIAEGDIPTAMEGAGLQALVLANGRKLSVKEALYASMSELSRARRNEAAAWMVEHGHASLVKTEVAVMFDRNDRDLAIDTAELLRARGFAPVVAENMNTSSVKSAINEMREQGIDVPLALFGAYLKKEAVIK